MRLLWLESRKTICRRYVLLALTLFLLLDILKIGMDYSAGKIREVAGNTPEMQAGFAKIYEKCKGPITEETAGFLASEYKRLCAEKADGTYSREYGAGKYSGYVFGDWYLMDRYFYKPFAYMVRYPQRMDEILVKVRENLDFYTSVGNSSEAAKSRYILSHYTGRHIDEFALTDGWESLLSFDFSDLLILLLLILGVAAGFTRETETGMELLLRSSRRGRWPMLLSKCGAAVLFAVLLTAAFSAVNFITYGVLCGFEGSGLPLYALESYQNTPYDGTIASFYLLCSTLKAVGFALCALWLLLLSVLSKKSLYPCLFGIGLIALFEYLSGFAASEIGLKGCLAALSPLSLLSAPEIMQNLCGFSLGGMYILRLWAFGLAQICIAAVLLFIVRRRSC